MNFIKKHYKTCILSLIIILIISMIFGIAIGSTYIEFSTVYKSIINKTFGNTLFQVNWDVLVENIIFDVRMPRVFLAAITGAGLAICGILMQCVTKNSIADPYILGISSGASSGAVFAIVLGGTVLGVTTGAFLGSILCAILVFIIGTQYGKSSSITRLVLSGLAMSTIFTAITNLIIYSAENSNQARSAMFWIMGSLGGARWNNLLLPTLVLVITLVITILLSNSLDLLLFGDTSAVVLGMNIKLIKSVILLLATFLTSVLVSITGAIGFIGLVVPHISRSIAGTAHKKILPLSALIGAIFLVISDIVSRVIFSPRELPIGIITSVIGGPFFILLIAKNNYSFGGNE